MGNGLSPGARFRRCARRDAEPRQSRMLIYELECTTGLVTPSWASTGARVKGSGNDAKLFDVSGAGEKAYRVAIK